MHDRGIIHREVAKTIGAEESIIMHMENGVVVLRRWH